MTQVTYVNRSATRSHEDRVLAALRRLGPLTRAQLVTHVQLSRTTLSQVISGLLAAGAIQAVRDDRGARTPGRPVELLHLTPSSGHVLGVDLSRRRAHIAVANAAHDVVLSAAVEYPLDSDWPTRVRVTANRVRRLAHAAGVSLSGLKGVGVGLAGPVATVWQPDPQDTEHSVAGDGAEQDPREVVVKGLAQLTREHFEQEFGVPTITDNNIRFAGLAEAIWGAGAGSPEQLYLRISHGMAGSLITGGQVLTGSAGLAGEIGHVTVDDDGDPCHCGNRGCLEGLVSVPALLAATGLPDATTLARQWRQGDAAVTDVVEQAAARVGRVLAVVVMAANPSMIVLGGDLVEALPELAPLVERHMRAGVIPAMSPYVDLRPATLGESSGARGAIAAVLQRSPESQTT